MKKYFLNTAILLLFNTAVIMSGCKKGPDYTTYNYPTETATGISPASGFTTSNVTIKGSNFGTLKGAVKVYFNGILASNIVSVVNDQIVVKVPANAVSGKVSLSVWTNTIDSVGTFTVLAAPAIISDSSRSIIAPVIAASSDTVDIKGTNFLTDPAQVAVDFNGVPAAKIATLTSTFIQVIAPASYTAGNLNVTFSGFKIACPTALSPSLQPGDVSAYFLKNYKYPISPVENATPTSSGSVRWFTPQNWTVTDNIKNHNNGSTGSPAGGLDFRPFSGAGPQYGVSGFQFLFGVEAGWGASAIVNGKVYQTTTLLPGTYKFSTRMRQNGFGSEQMMIVAAAGTTLPDASNVSNSTTLGFKSFNLTNHDGGSSDSQYDDFNFTFTVTSKSQVTLGFIVPNLGSGGAFCRFEWFKLELQ